MQVRAERPAHATALEPALAVVPEAGEDAAERDGARIEQRATGVVLEAGHGPALARLELALEQDVADHAPLAGDGLEREEPGALEPLPARVAVPAAEQLIAAADREERGSAVDLRRQRVPLLREVGGDERLLAVLAAADVVQGARSRLDPVAEPDRAHLELVPPPRRAPRQHRDVAAVGVDVQVVGIEVADAIVTRAPSPSSYARSRARPRSGAARASRCRWGGPRARRRAGSARARGRVPPRARERPRARRRRGRRT